jgi:glycosyltransferase involved in cell wall biosynthesis
VSHDGTRPRIVYWNNIPSPYAVARLNAVVARGNLAIEGWFCARTEADRSWAIHEAEFRFPWRYLPGGEVRLPGSRAHYFNIPTGLISRNRPDLLVSLYAEPAFIAGWWAARTAGVRVAFRYLPVFGNVASRSGLGERFKRELFTRTDGFKTSGPAGRAALETYGVDPRRIHYVTQSIDVAHWESSRLRWQSQRDQLRRDFGAIGTTFLYVGRLRREKGVDDLLAAYGQLADLDTTLLLAGDGEDEPIYRALVAEHGLRNVRFLGFLDHDQLPRAYAAADALVLPTLLDRHGLVVEEAMASGIPVISTEAAGDVRLRVPEGVAGFVVAVADPRVFADRMRTIAMDPPAAKRMGIAAMALASARGNDQYAVDFELFVERVLAMPRARST